MVRNHGTHKEITQEYYAGEKIKHDLYENFNLRITSKGELSQMVTLGKNGELAHVSEYASSISWRETTKPYGIIAVKRVSPGSGRPGCGFVPVQ